LYGTFVGKSSIVHRYTYVRTSNCFQVVRGTGRVRIKGLVTGGTVEEETQ
jgi:hypothetical protein